MAPALIEAYAQLAWPLLAAAILAALLPTLIRLVRSRGITIRYGEMEISVQEVSDQLRKQVDDLQNQVRELIAVGPPPVRYLTEEPAAGGPGPPLQRGPILWVDDKPKNNAHEIAKLGEDGWDIQRAESTKAALQAIESSPEPPALVISDMARLEGFAYRRTAGLDLLRALRARGLDLPLIIYASPEAERTYAEEVRKLGGGGITASPLELFRLVEQVAARRTRAGA